MPQNKIKAVFVAGEHLGEQALDEEIQAAVLDMPLVTQKKRAHHRRQRQ